MEASTDDENFTLVLNQPDYLDPGYVGEALTRSGRKWTLESRSDFDWRLDERVNAVVLLGSVENPLDMGSQLRANELNLIEQILKRDIPLFAVCYGAQLLAQCLSARVFELDKVGFGFRTVEFSPDSLPTGPQFFWHHFGYECPVEASAIANNGPACDAFVYKKSLAVQFHPEATPQMLNTWMRAGSAEVQDIGADPEYQLRASKKHKNYSVEFMDTAFSLLNSL